MKRLPMIGVVACCAFALTACEPNKKDADKPEAEATSATEAKEDTEAKETTRQGQTEADGDKEMAEPAFYIDPGAEEPEQVNMAVATVYPTEGNEVMGTILFTQTEKGVEYKTNFSNLPEGKHAYHIHVYGNCSGEDGKTAGTHFNFGGSSLNPPEDIDRITGNLGDVEPDDEGNAKAEGVLEDASLQGMYSIIGRSVIIHAKANDPKSPPIGAAGGRLGCGVIGLTAAK